MSILNFDNIRLTSRPAFKNAFLALLGVIPLMVVVVIVLRTPTLTLPPLALETWLVGVLLFALADFAANSFNYRQWNGYRNLAAVTLYLSFGLGAALGVVIVGTIVGSVLRRLLKTHSPHPSFSLQRLLQGALTRSAISGIPLLATAAVYALFNGIIPVARLEAAVIVPLLPALLVNLATAWALESLLHPGALHKLNALNELQMLLLMVTMPLILFNAGFVVFVVVIGLVATLLLRHWQIEDTQHSLSRRVQELSLLNNIGQMTSANLDLDDVLLNIYHQVIQFVDLSVFYIALYDKEQNTLDYRLVMADGQAVKWASRKLGNGVIEQIIQQRTPLRISANQQPPGRDFTPSAGFLTFVGVPLLAGTDVLGVMAVLSSESENAFRDDEVNILQTIASQAGLAVRNAVLFTQRTQLAENLSLINKLAQQDSFYTDRDEALRTTCQTAMTIVDAQKAAVLLLDKEKNVLHLASHVGLTPTHIQVLSRGLPYVPELYTPRVVVNTSDNPALSAVAKQGEFRSFAEVPLQSATTPLGLLTVFHDAPHFYRQAELDLLSALANQVASALDNAQLFQALELYAFEMTQLLHLSRTSTSSLELNRVVSNIAEIFRQMMNVNRVILTLIDPAAASVQELASVVNSEVQPAHLDGVPLNSIPELLNLTHEMSLTVYQRDGHPISEGLRHLMSQNDEATIAVVPLIAEGALIGAVLLGSQKPRVFTRREWQFMEMAANQVTAQIKNVQLYEETQEKLRQRLEQLSTIEEIAQQVSSSLDFNQTISNVLEAAMHSTQADLVCLGLITDAGPFWVIEQSRVNGKLHKNYSSQAREAGVLGEVVRTGRPVLVPDNSAYDHYVTEAPDVYRSSLAVPLFQKGRVIGALNLESVHLNFFDEQQIGFLNNLASHAVISIENARQLAERQYEIDMLTSLRALSLWLASSDDTRSVAEAVLRQGLQMLQGQDAALFAYHENADDVTLLAQLWSSNAEAEFAEFPRQFAHAVARGGAMRVIEDVCRSEFYLTHEATPYTSVIGMPMKRGYHVRFVLVMTFAEQRSFHERDTNTLDLLTSQALGHLENATLHERIRAARDQMRAILDSTRDGMILLDREVRLVEYNPAAEHLLGIDLEDHIGEYFPDTLLNYAESVSETGYSREEVQNMARILRLEPEINTRRDFQHTARNHVRYIEEIGSPVMDDHHQIVGRLLVLRDVTEAKRLQETREDLTKMIVHDLRGPLGAIIQTLELALPSIDQPDLHDEARKLMASSLTSANRLLRLVSSLLDVAKMEDSGMKLDLEPTSVSAIVETAFSTLLPLIQQAALHVQFALPADLPLVTADHDKIERVLINLLDNALRYTPKGGEIHVSAAVLDEQRMVKIRVADSGPGIPPHERDRIFEKFRRVKGRDPLRGSKGSGLGLTFCRLTIEAHGGRIKVEDESPLAGACFSFTLPIA